MKFIPLRKALLALALAPLALLAQVSTIPAEADEIDPDGTLKILVNVNQMDNSEAFVANLQDSVEAGADLYLWTWQPAEHPEGHPLVNGTGDRPWQSSNDSLKMTKEGSGVFSFTMVPTAFYEVTAQEVYDNDISFLVKTKNGGGYGDPDVKSPDLSVLVDPPLLERRPAYLFPGTFKETDLVQLYYDNNKEQKPSMQNLSASEAYFYAEATLADSTVTRIARNSFSVGPKPELQLEDAGGGIFKKYFIPREFFDVPAGLSIKSIKCYVQKKTYLSGQDRISYDVTADVGCQ